MSSIIQMYGKCEEKKNCMEVRTFIELNGQYN